MAVTPVDPATSKLVPRTRGAASVQSAPATRMCTRLVAPALAFALGSATAAVPCEAQGPARHTPATGSVHLSSAAGPPRYLAAIRGELDAMHLPYACETVTASHASCSFRQENDAGVAALTIRIAESDVTNTVYLYVDHYLLAPPDATTTPRLLARLMELNWQMLGTKLEWNAESGEVRLSAVLSTASNFNRKAFRSLVRTLVGVADRYRPELRALTGRR